MQGNEQGRIESQTLTESKKREARRDEIEIPVHADRNDFGEAGQSGGENGCEPVGSVGTNFSPSHTQHRKISIREVLGKILSRVDELEAKHLAYVESHEKRLEQRLSESKVSKEEALQLIAEIREMTALLDKQLDEEGEE